MAGGAASCRWAFRGVPLGRQSVALMLGTNCGNKSKQRDLQIIHANTFMIREFTYIAHGVVGSRGPLPPSLDILGHRRVKENPAGATAALWMRYGI